VGYFAVNVDAAGSTAAYTENYASVLLDYSLSKRTDVYAGLMNETTGKASTNNQNLIAVGMRHKF
jgi:predicted porin